MIDLIEILFESGARSKDEFLAKLFDLYSETIGLPQLVSDWEEGCSGENENEGVLPIVAGFVIRHAVVKVVQFGARKVAT